MSQITPEQIEALLTGVADRYTDSDIVSAGIVRRIAVDGRHVQVELVVGYPAGEYLETLTHQVSALIQGLGGGISPNVTASIEIVPHSVQSQLLPLPEIKNIIAVASGKGGVGKSTTSVNLALAITRDGGRAALLDADIYGPSQPKMLGYVGRPTSQDGKRIAPVERYGLQSMSVGYLIDEEQPMVWRGPMVTQALTQLLRDTLWKDVDYLIIDLPPGTGDIQLTLAQQIPVSGAVVVTTPQDIALLDARKALKMFEKVGIPVLGVVENMSTHICSQCGHEEHIFGQAGGRRMAEQYEVPFLGEVPLDIRIREQADGGQPTVEAEPDSPLAMAYREMARRATARLATLSHGEAPAFPEIVILDD